MVEFWAKTNSAGEPGISVYQHMLNVGHVAKAIAQRSPELLHRFDLSEDDVAALAALHDLGKISPGFQRKCGVWLKDNCLVETDRKWCWDTAAESDHGRVSHAAVQDFLIQSGISRRVAKYLAAILGGHHGRMKSLPDPRGIRLSQTDKTGGDIDWYQARLNCAQQLWEHFGPASRFEKLDDSAPALWWIAGLTSVADWIGSDERLFPADSFDNVENSASVARTALESIGFMRPHIKQRLTFEQLFGFPPNEMQIRTIAAITGPGVYIVEAPMGMGKTEAALGAAYSLLASGKANGIYFALPTQVTSNRIHLRMNDFLQRISHEQIHGRLIHGNSWLLDDSLQFHPSANGPKTRATDDARNGRDWFASAKRALLAPYGVGTVDQALLGVVAAKHFFVRHFALASKVVILDEVHSYDLYTGTLIDKLITTLEGLGCTVIVLSATLSNHRRGQILCNVAEGGPEQPYPLISGRTEGVPFEPLAATAPNPRKVKVDFKKSEDAFDDALTLARQGGAVLWICNTVFAAQSCFRRFRELAEADIPLGLLHSRFPFWRREDLEAAWMSRFGKSGANRCGSILVSTQVVEQSVDLDADLLVTELAPTDMLLQRLGRLWRHERANRPIPAPRVCILEEGTTIEEFRQMEPTAIIKSLGGKANVYAPYVLLRSLEVWKGLPAEVVIPTQIRSLIERTYEDREQEPQGWIDLYGEWYGTDSAKKMKAQMSSNIWQVALDDREGVQTRLNEMPTVAMVLCLKLTDREAQFVDGTSAELPKDDFRFPTAKAIHRNLVKVPEYCFERVEPCAAWESYLYGSQCVGIVAADGKVNVKGLKDKFRLHYSDELGLLIEKLSGKGDV